MGRKKAVEEQPEPVDKQPEGSPVAGALVLAVLAVAALAVVYAVSPDAAIFTIWVVGAGTVWKLVRSTANPAPPPAPEGAVDEKPQFTIVEDREGHCTVKWQKGVNGS